jgi:Na+/melibiose symporter-like transporter
MEVKKGRLGQFFLYIGLILLVVFFTTDRSEVSQIGFFFIGIFFAVMGVIIIWKDWKRPPSARFRLVKKLRKRRLDEQDTPNESGK